MTNYDWVTDEMFDRQLELFVAEMTAEDLLAIGGIYEILSEEFNNDVLSALESARELEEEDDG